MATTGATVKRTFFIDDILATSADSEGEELTSSSAILPKQQTGSVSLWYHGMTDNRGFFVELESSKLYENPNSKSGQCWFSLRWCVDYSA